MTKLSTGYAVKLTVAATGVSEFVTEVLPTSKAASEQAKADGFSYGGQVGDAWEIWRIEDDKPVTIAIALRAIEARTHPG